MEADRISERAEKLRARGWEIVRIECRTVTTSQWTAGGQGRLF
jgi:very-short-patch-repair endonuclease